MGISLVVQTGNLGSDVVVKTLESGTQVANISIADNYKYTDSQGNAKEIKTWYKVKAWGQVAINAATYLRKGDRVTVHGRLSQVEPWVNQDGERVKEMEIVANHIEYPPNAGTRQPAQTENSSVPKPPASVVPPPPPAKPKGPSYEDMIAGGWTDVTLRENGYAHLIPAARGGGFTEGEVGM